MVRAVVKPSHLLAAVLLLAPRPAGAHPEMSPTTVNRYLSVMVIGDRVEVFYTLLFGPLPGADERQRIDGDGNGQLSPKELHEAARGWETEADKLVGATVDGERIVLGKADVQLGDSQGIEAAPLVVEVYGSRELPSGTRRVRIEPGKDPPRLGETEVVLDLSPDWTLVSSRRGGGADGQDVRFKFDGPPVSMIEDRSVTYVVKSRNPLVAPSRKGMPGWMPLAALGVLLTGAIVALVTRVRAYRREKG